MDAQTQCEDSLFTQDHGGLGWIAKIVEVFKISLNLTICSLELLFLSYIFRGLVAYSILVYASSLLPGVQLLNCILLWRLTCIDNESLETGRKDIKATVA